MKEDICKKTNKKKITLYGIFCLMILWMMSSAYVYASTAPGVIRLSIGSIYYIGKDAKSIKCKNTKIAVPFKENAIAGKKVGTTLIQYKKSGKTYKKKIVVGRQRGYNINPYSGIYYSQKPVKISVKKGYKIYYMTNETEGKLHKITSGRSKVLPLTKTTTVWILEVKASQKVSKSFLKKRIKAAERYHYEILLSQNEKPDQGEPAKKEIATLSITLSETRYGYDRTEHIPEVIITDNDYTLVKGKDYKIDSPSGLKTGTYPVKIEGMGNYIGQVELMFCIEDSLITWYEILDDIGEALAEYAFTYSNSKIQNTWEKAMEADNKVCNCAAYICYGLQKLAATADNGFQGQIYANESGLVLKKGAALGTNIEKIVTNGEAPGQLESVLKEGDVCLFWLTEKSVGHMSVYAGKDQKGTMLWYNGGKDAVEGKKDGGRYLLGGVGPNDGKAELETGQVLMILRIISFAGEK